MSPCRFHIILLYSLAYTWFADATINPGEKSKSSKQPKLKSGPQNEDVFERNLVEKEPLAKDIIVHNAAYFKGTSRRRFNGTVLGYVTTWNSHGYDVAKMFTKKFDLISPVWLQIIKNGDSYAMEGVHDVDSGWMRDLRKKGRINERKTTKIFPRVIFDKFTEKDYSRLLSLEKDRIKVNDLIVKVCKDNGFDGIILEFWAQLAGRVDDRFLYTLVLEMNKALQKENLRMILVIPPLRPDAPNLFGEKHLNELYKDIYAFSLMTYDYSNIQRPGANAPLNWVRRSIENLAPENCYDFKIKRRKILMGLNMYGYDFTPDGGGPIINDQYLSLAKHVKKRLNYDEKDVENFFEIRTDSGRHTVFYPTLYSINERIELAQEMGAGISIWELGQGLDYFYDLF